MHCVGKRGCYLVNSHCELQGADPVKKESYQANWLNLVMETRPQYMVTLSEKNVSRKESYEQEQVVHFVVNRNPSQTLKLGNDRGLMTEHHLPSKTTHFVPPINPVTVESSLVQHRATPYPSFPQVPVLIVAQRENNGVCMDKQDVSIIKKDLPKLTRPIRVNFRATNIMSSPRQTSHKMQIRQ